MVLPAASVKFLTMSVAGPVQFLSFGFISIVVMSPQSEVLNAAMVMLV